MSLIHSPAQEHSKLKTVKVIPAIGTNSLALSKKQESSQMKLHAKQFARKLPGKNATQRQSNVSDASRVSQAAILMLIAKQAVTFPMPNAMKRPESATHAIKLRTRTAHRPRVHVQVLARRLIELTLYAMHKQESVSNATQKQADQAVYQILLVMLLALLISHQNTIILAAGIVQILNACKAQPEPWIRRNAARDAKMYLMLNVISKITSAKDAHMEQPTQHAYTHRIIATSSKNKDNANLKH